MSEFTVHTPTVIDFRRCAAHGEVSVDLATCEPCRVHCYAALLEIEPPGCPDHSGDSQPDCTQCVARAQFRQVQLAFFGEPGPRRLFFAALLGSALAIAAYLLGHEQAAYVCGGVSNVSLVAWFVYARVASRRRIAACYRQRMADSA